MRPYSACHWSFPGDSLWAWAFDHALGRSASHSSMTWVGQPTALALSRMGSGNSPAHRRHQIVVLETQLGFEVNDSQNLAISSGSREHAKRRCRHCCPRAAGDPAIETL